MSKENKLRKEEYTNMDQIGIVAQSYVGITIDCKARAEQRNASGMDLREVGKDTSRKLEQPENTDYRTKGNNHGKVQQNKIIIGSLIIITQSMKVTLVGTTIFVRPD